MPIFAIPFLRAREWKEVKRDEGIQRALGRYVKTADDELPAKFVIAKKVAAEFSLKESEAELWRTHGVALKDFRKVEKDVDAGRAKLGDLPTPGQSLLDLKIALATKIMQACHFCVRKCGVNRLKGQLGFCRAGVDWKIFGAHHHFGEESVLVPSGTIFQAACMMRCLYCQNYPESITPELGETWSVERVARWMEGIRREGARNINWVGGSPTPWTWQILHAMKQCNVNVPQVWNSSSYYSPETAKLLDGVIDVYLLDFRYWSNKCAERLSAAPHYREAAIANHLAAAKAGEVLVRLLVLPNHVECDAKPIVTWIAKELGNDVHLNLMSQYRPEAKAFDYSDIARRLNRDEYDVVVEHAKKLGLWNVEVQGM